MRALILLCWYGPIMQSVKQVYNSPGTKYLALVDDIMTLHINGVALPEETADFMEQCTDIQRVQTYYAQDPTYFDNLCDYEFIDRNKTTVQLLTMYMDTYLRHPILMTRQILTRMLVGWDVSERLGRSTAVGITEYAQGNTVFENFPDYYGDRTENILTKLLDQLNEWTLRSPQRMFFWRTGFFVVLLVAELLIANCFGVLKRTLVLFTPVFAHMIGIVLCVIWSNYRYYWPIEAVALLGVPMLGAIIYTSKYSKESAHEKKI